jgi:hypothetical protein
VFYVQTISQELSQTTSYCEYNKQPNEIITDHIAQCIKLNVIVNITDKKLPSLYWIPKLHKTPYKSRFIANSVSCTTKQLSVYLTSALSAIRYHIAKFCNKVYENSNINLFWSIKNTLEVIDKIENKKYKVSQVSTYDFSTLYTTLPHALIKSKLVSLIEKTFAREKCLYLALNTKTAFFTNQILDNYIIWTGLDFCAALTFLLDNLFVEFNGKIFKQIIGVPMGTNCAPLIADLFLYCYESEFMLELSKTKQVDLINCFNLTSRYIDDILNLDNPLFEQYIHKIYPKELVLNRSCISNTDAAYLDLHLTINNNLIKTSLYDKRDDFNFEIVNFPFLDGNIPKGPSYGIYISQLVRYARACSCIKDFNDRNLILTKKLLKQGFLYHNLRNKFARFYSKYGDLISKYNVSLKWHLNNGISHPSFYGDVLKRVRKLKYVKPNVHIKLFNLINLFLSKGYDAYVLKNTCLMVFDSLYLSSLKIWNH